jgi:hypothetical protein
MKKYEFGLVFRKTMMVLSFSLVLPVALVALYHHRDIILGTSGVHKLLMPETYSVYLPKGGYQVWNFSVWSSKGVHTKASDLQLTVLDSANKRTFSYQEKNNVKRILLSPLPYRPSPTSKQFGQTVGAPELDYEIEKTGTYTVSCNQKCVVVIVPDRECTSIMYNPYFMGENDDWNFDKPARK